MGRDLDPDARISPRYPSSTRTATGCDAAAGRTAPRLRPALGVAGALLGLGVQDGAQGLEQRVHAGVLAAVGQVEAVVEVRRVLSLVVLQDGLQLVQRLGHACLGRLRR